MARRITTTQEYVRQTIEWRRRYEAMKHKHEVELRPLVRELHEIWKGWMTYDTQSTFWDDEHREYHDELDWDGAGNAPWLPHSR